MQCLHWSGKKYHSGSPDGPVPLLNLTSLKVAVERSGGFWYVPCWRVFVAGF
jgi:hypothetical protein